MVPLGVAFVQETTIFREFGPLAGSTMRLAYEVAPKIGNTLSRQTLDVDARKYFRLGGTGLLALRARGFKSWGENPDFIYFGGNSELRGYDYLSFVGQNAFFLNAELRFPLIEAMATPIGILGGIRATLFANLGGAYFEGHAVQGLHATTRTLERADHRLRRPDRRSPIYGAADRSVDGFRLVDARALLRHQPADLRARLPASTSTGRGGRCSTRSGKTSSSPQTAAARRSARPKFTMWIGYDW